MSIDLAGGREVEEEEERRREEEEKRRKLQDGENEKIRVEDENRKDVESLLEEGGQGEEVQHRLEATSASLAAAVQAVEHKIKEDDTQNE